MHVNKIDEYKTKINHNVWEEVISVTPCIDICIDHVDIWPTQVDNNNKNSYYSSL